MDKIKGLTLSIIIEANSANYGESLGNVATLKKIVKSDGYEYPYISRQAIRYNIIEQLGEDVSKVVAEGSGDKKVIQFTPESTIIDYPELDFFGYMKTQRGADSTTRSAVVRLSHAISLGRFNGELDFLTNKGLADRLNENMNIAMSEMHQAFYKYTITVDLDKIGIDVKTNASVDNTEKARRINKLLQTIAFLYRDIRGRREDLKPLFIIGGIYDVKNPIFQNALNVKNNKIILSTIKGLLFDEIKDNTLCGLIEGLFDNDNEIQKELNAISMPQFFESLKRKVNQYYESC